MEKGKIIINKNTFKCENQIDFYRCLDHIKTLAEDNVRGGAILIAVIAKECLDFCIKTVEDNCDNDVINDCFRKLCSSYYDDAKICIYNNDKGNKNIEISYGKLKKQSVVWKVSLEITIENIEQTFNALRLKNQVDVQTIYENVKKSFIYNKIKTDCECPTTATVDKKEKKINTFDVLGNIFYGSIVLSTAAIAVSIGIWCCKAIIDDIRGCSSSTPELVE